MSRIHTISVSESGERVWQDARVLASRRGWSMSRLVREALERELRIAGTPNAYLLGEEGDEDDDSTTGT